MAKSRHSIKPKLFTLGNEARKGLAEILRRHQDPDQRRPEVIRGVIDDLERRARAFVETRAPAAVNSDAAVLRAIRDLQHAAARLHDLLRTLPPRASALLSERLLLERAVAPGFLEVMKKNMRHLGYAAERVRAALAPSPRGGHPTDRRGQLFATDLAVVLSDYGIQPTKYTEGPLAECLEILFEAVGHPPGDMSTLLKAVQEKVGGLPTKTF